MPTSSSPQLSWNALPGSQVTGDGAAVPAPGDVVEVDLLALVGRGEQEHCCQERDPEDYGERPQDREAHKRCVEEW